MLKAFPSATGAGAYTSGGRGGIIVHVTNLNDSGTGSLRAALTMTVPRIIVFDISGIITINKLLYLDGNNSNFYLAGQTAPEGGITIAGGIVYFSSVSNYIMRHIRFKGGFQADWIPNSGDNLGSASFAGIGTQLNIIVDHVSFGFGKTMPTWTQQGPDDRVVDKVTIQRSFFSESNKGAIIGRDVDQNLFLAGDMTFSKNVFYNVRYRTPNTNAMHEGDNSFDVINNLSWNIQGRIIRGAGNVNLNHINNATYIRTYTTGDIGLNLWSKNWIPQIYTSGNFLEITSRGSLTNTVEQMNNDNSLSWKLFDFNGPNYGDQLPANFFVNNPYSIKGESQTILNALDLRTTLPNDVGCNARLNADGTVSDNKDVHDASYLQNILNDVMVNPIDENSYAITPITSVSRSNDFYVSNPHIPEIWFQANVPPGQDHNDIAPSGYTWIEEYINQVDGEVAPPPPVINVTGVNLIPQTLTLTVGQTSLITADVLPSNATDKSGVWTSNNINVATVNSAGLVTATGEGSTLISFTTNNGSFIDTTSLTVNAAPPIETTANYLLKKVKFLTITQ